MESNVPKTKPFHIAIVGGGLGGIALTIGLLRHGIVPRVYEAASNFGEIGNGVSFGPNSVRALQLLSPEALAAFKKEATYNQAPEKANAFCTFLYGTASRNGNGKQCGDFIWELEGPEMVRQMCDGMGTKVMSTVHRARFLDEMVKLLPEGITSFKRRLTHVDDLGDDGVKLYFADGTIESADAVIGCDGVKSSIRGSVFKRQGKEVVQKYVGEYAYRSLIEAEVAERVLGTELAMNGTFWEGYGGYVIHYPVDHGEMVNVVALVRDESKEWKHEETTYPATREEMYQDFREWDPRIQALLREFKTSDKWSLWDLIHDEPYHHGRICLMGDAAHATTPHLGAGAGLAMEDAYILSNLVATANHASELGEVFRVYDDLRRERTQKVIRKSREASKAAAFGAEGIDDNHEALVKDASERFLWIWEYDLKESLEKGKGSLMNGTRK